jgi:hypothetical protein
VRFSNVGRERPSRNFDQRFGQIVKSRAELIADNFSQA